MKQFLMLAFVILPVALFAQEASAPDMADQIIQTGLSIANSVPFIGEYLPLVLKIMGVIAVVLTSVSAILMGVSSAFNIVGLSKVSELIQKFLPYIQKASMFNVQKKV